MRKEYSMKLSGLTGAALIAAISGIAPLAILALVFIAAGSIAGLLFALAIIAIVKL